MLKRSSGLVIFDITQLALRAVLPTPSGIGRVELAYAKHFATNYPGIVRFGFGFMQLVKLIPNAVALRYIAEIERVWKNEDRQSDDFARRIEKFVSAPLGALSSQTERLKAGGPRDRNRAYLLSELAIRSALGFFGSRKLFQIAESSNQNVYVSVSNSIIGSNRLRKWLANSPSIKKIFLLHDIIPITNPEYTIPSRTTAHERYARRLASEADLIIANSDYTRDCYAEYADKVEIKSPEIAVSQLGVDECFAPTRDLFESGKPYFVYIGTIEPRKNHVLLLQVWQRLAEKLGSACPKLILIGRRGWENENVVDLLDRSVALREHVLECSNIPDGLLVKIVANARAALFPSLIEGFGLPVAEALAVGTPVICSDLPPFHEVAGDIPDYVDPLAGRGWIKLIADYSRPDGEMRGRQLSRMKGFKPPRWKDHMRVIDNALLRCGLSDLPREPKEAGARAGLGSLGLEPVA